jgi:hypothetical protein
MRFQPIGALMDIYRKIKPKEKPIRGRPPQFTNEFMQMVARKVVDEGMTYQVAAKTFKSPKAQLESGSQLTGKAHP